MSALVDQPFDTRNPSGWIVENGGGGSVTHVGDESSEPISPNGALRFTWPTGSTAENPGIIENTFPTARHIFIGMTVKIQSPSVWGFDGIEKLLVVNQREGCRSRALLEINGALNNNGYTGSIGFLGFYGLPDLSDEPALYPNASGVRVPHDQWVKVEMELVASSSDWAADGVYRLWINDALVLDYSNLRMSGCEWNTLQIWPQMGHEVPRVVPQNIYIGHVYIARG